MAETTPREKTPRKELLVSEKREICIYKEENPAAKIMDIAKHFVDKWGHPLSRFAVSDILSRKRCWMMMETEDKKESTKRVRRSKNAQLEEALHVALCDVASNSGIPITNQIIKEQATKLADLEPNDYVELTVVQIAGFCRRFGLTKDLSSHKKSSYAFESLFMSPRELVEDLKQTGLDNVYLLIPVPLYNEYTPKEVNRKVLTVFLCVNATGTDMMIPLVAGYDEHEEHNSNVHYVEVAETAWGYVHWLLAAEEHIQTKDSKQALVIIGPESYIPCLPFKSNKLRVRKLNSNAYSSVKDVFQRITNIFKTSFRHHQLKDKTSTNCLTKFLEYIDEAWSSLPGGALHGYWHQVTDFPKHNCSLPPDVTGLCSAIDKVAIDGLSAVLSGSQNSAVDLVNLEASIPRPKGNLTANDIVAILTLYNRMSKSRPIGSSHNPKKITAKTNHSTSKKIKLIESSKSNFQLPNSQKDEISVNSNLPIPIENNNKNKVNSELVVTSNRLTSNILKTVTEVKIPKSSSTTGVSHSPKRLSANPNCETFKENKPNEIIPKETSKLDSQSPTRNLQNNQKRNGQKNTVNCSPSNSSTINSDNSVSRKTNSSDLSLPDDCFNGNLLEPEPVTVVDAIEGIDKVIRYFNRQSAGKSLYKAAIKIWNYLELEKNMK